MLRAPAQSSAVCWHRRWLARSDTQRGAACRHARLPACLVHWAASAGAAAPVPRKPRRRRKKQDRSSTQQAAAHTACRRRLRPPPAATHPRIPAELAIPPCPGKESAREMLKKDGRARIFFFLFDIICHAPRFPTNPFPIPDARRARGDCRYERRVHACGGAQAPAPALPVPGEIRSSGTAHTHADRRRV